MKKSNFKQRYGTTSRRLTKKQMILVYRSNFYILDHACPQKPTFVVKKKEM